MVLGSNCTTSLRGYRLRLSSWISSVLESKFMDRRRDGRTTTSIKSWSGNFAVFCKLCVSLIHCDMKRSFTHSHTSFCWPLTSICQEVVAEWFFKVPPLYQVLDPKYVHVLIHLLNSSLTWLDVNWKLIPCGVVEWWTIAIESLDSPEFKGQLGDFKLSPNAREWFSI